jgi:hypothetical protein
MQETTKINTLIVLLALILIGIVYIAFRSSTPRGYAYAMGPGKMQNQQTFQGGRNQQRMGQMGKRQGNRQGNNRGRMMNGERPADCPYANQTVDTNTVQ